MFGSIGMPELIIILVIALIIFGPRKLPELGKSLGQSINEFKRASADLQNTLEQEIKLEEQKETAGARRLRRRHRSRRRSSTRRRPVVAQRRRSPVAGDRSTDGARAISRNRSRAERRRARRRTGEEPSPARRLSARRRRGLEEPPEGRMTFLEHLDELRKRITHAVVGAARRLPDRVRLHRTHLALRLRAADRRRSGGTR